MADSEANDGTVETERIVVTRRMNDEGQMFNQQFWSQGIDPTTALGILEAVKVRFQMMLMATNEDVE